MIETSFVRDAALTQLRTKSLDLSIQRSQPSASNSMNSSDTVAVSHQRSSSMEVTSGFYSSHSVASSKMPSSSFEKYPGDYTIKTLSNGEINALILDHSNNFISLSGAELKKLRLQFTENLYLEKPLPQKHSDYPGDDAVADLQQNELLALLHRERSGQYALNGHQIKIIRKQIAKNKLQAQIDIVEREHENKPHLQPVAANRFAAMDNSKEVRKTLKRQIKANLRSKNPAFILEGKVARILSRSVMSLGKTFFYARPGETDALRKGTVGEIDIETAHSIVEVTMKARGKFNQIHTRLMKPPLNPLNKSVILFAPNYTYTQQDELNKINVVVARTAHELATFQATLEGRAA